MPGFGRRMGWLVAGCLATGAASSCLAQAVSPNLQNVSFGTLTATTIYTDQINRQNTCSFAGLLATTYSVTASGNGAGSAFTVTNGTSAVPYQVQWAQTSGASAGTPLTANVPLTGQTTAPVLAGVSCLLGLTNATLIVIVPSTELLKATKGSYTGSLSVLLTPQ